jgi:hypothetical protein
MKKILIMLLIFAITAIMPLRVSALQPPRTMSVYGIEGYRFLLELAAAEDEETFNRLQIYMTNRGILRGGISYEHHSWGRDNLELFIHSFETLRLPVLRGDELGWVEFREFSMQPNLSVYVSIDSPVGFLDRKSPDSNSFRSFSFNLSLGEEYVDGMEMIERNTPWSDRLIDYNISQGYHRAWLYIHPRHDPYMPDMCVRELFDFKTLAEILEEFSSAAETPSALAARQVAAAIIEGIVPPHLLSEHMQPITRAEFAALAVMMYETSTGREIFGRAYFSDTNDPNVQKLARIGVVSGVGGGNFSPDELLTREQAAAIILRLLNVIAPNRLPQTTQANFSDYSQISSWAKNAATQMAYIMGGMEIFYPQGTVTREQAIVFMYRANFQGHTGKSEMR